jgi:hypothetical protein
MRNIKLLLFWGVISCTIFIISNVSLASSVKEARKNIIVNEASQEGKVYALAGYTYNYSHGSDLTVELSFSEKKMRSLLFRLGLFDNYTLYGIEYLFHDSGFGQSPFWFYKGCALYAEKDQQYIGIPIGLQSNWGGYIEAVPMLSRSNSIVLARIGMKADASILKVIWDILSSIPLGGGW